MTPIDSRTIIYVVILFLSASIVGLTGCDNPDRSSEEKPDSPPMTDASMRGYGSPPGDSLTPGNVDLEQISEESSTIAKAAGTASTWTEAHQKVRSILSSSSTVPQFVREQDAALVMFREYLNTDRWRDSLSQEKLEVLGFYTDLLVENRSPESELVYTGLRGLDGHWSDQRIIEAAETTIQAAKQRYGSREKTKGSQSDASESKNPTPGLAESEERRATRALQANHKLRKMVDRKQEKR